MQKTPPCLDVIMHKLADVLSDSTSGRLHQHLLGDYTIQRPVHHWYEPVHVYVLFSLRQIRQLVSIHNDIICLDAQSLSYATYFCSTAKVIYMPYTDWPHRHCFRRPVAKLVPDHLQQQCLIHRDKISIYHRTSNISRALVGDKTIDHSHVVGASPISAAPTTSLFST